MKLLEIILQYLPNTNIYQTLPNHTVYFWSDGCSGQFRSKYTFRSMSYYPQNLKLFWDYGEAHHFKGPHDGIGGTVKRKVYQDVTASKVVIKDAKHFAEYANNAMNVKIDYIDKSDVTVLDLSDAVYIYGTLQIHHLERVSKSKSPHTSNQLIS